MSTITTSPPGTRRASHAGVRPPHRQQRLGRYSDPLGRERELVDLPGAGGSTLVIDRLAGTLADPRLIAHLSADEPTENAQITAALYLADRHGRHCRALTAEDLTTTPGATAQTHIATDAQDMIGADGGAELVDRHGRVYRLEPTQCEPVPQLRWSRHPPDGEGAKPQPVTVRKAIGSLESYEPLRTLTAHALAVHHADPRLSVTVLRAELDRLSSSPIVLNRRLREAVLAAASSDGLSMSEIAARCGRVKHDTHGNQSGETSWLGRRIGILPEGGADTPTPWVSSDVLALIARSGLGLAPREVELG
ncbi:MAG: hypothetical protein ACRDJX_07690 [Solirubrobacteraceae bacterium]